MAVKRKSGWGKWVTLLVLAGAVAAGVAWYSKRPKEDAPDYKTATVTRGDITQIVTANGQLSPVKNVQVGSQISGIINEIKVDFNSRVKEGEVIAQIDPSTYQRAVEQADAEVANAKAGLRIGGSGGEARRATKRGSNLSRSRTRIGRARSSARPRPWCGCARRR